MDCKDVSELISAYVDQELSDDEMLTLRTHLADCKSCEALVQEFESLSILSRNTFSNMTAPEWIEQKVMQEIALRRQSKQGFRLLWVAICSAVAMTALAVGGGFTLMWSFSWTLARLIVHLVHGVDVLLLQLVLAQSWLVVGTIIVGVVITVMCLSGISKLMKKPFDPRLSS